MDDNHRLRDAKNHVAALKGFYIHLAVFILVMLLLLAVNVATATPWWVQWPLLGWGIGLIGHAVGVFGRVPVIARDWEARQVAAYMAKNTGGDKPPAKPPV